MKKLENVEIADNIVATSIGLIGRKSFGDKNGLLIKNANGIHTFGVFFPIDVVFLDKTFKILKLVENLKPFRFSPIVWRAKHVLELPAGAIKNLDLSVDDTIDLS